MQKLCASATALRTIVHFDLELTRGCLLWLLHRLPLGCDHIHDEVTRFVGAAKSEGQLATRFIDDPTRNIFLLASHVVITGAVVATGETTAGKLPDFSRRFTLNTQAFHIPPNLVVRSFRRALIPSRGQDLQVEHPVGCGYSPALYFHPT